MKNEKLQKILKDHKAWLLCECDGERADLRGTDLTWANLSGADLSRANLHKADLRGADLRGANLKGADLRSVDLRGADLYKSNLLVADLRGANLRYADLGNANLRGAILHYADLQGADLRDGADLYKADLRGANLHGVKCDESTAFFALQCPEEGPFVAFKKCRNNVIVKLLITEDALRSSATSRKCRASKAVVLDVIGAEKGISTHDNTFIYETGKEVSVKDFDTDRWNECTTGIHFFITRKEAESF